MMIPGEGSPACFAATASRTAAARPAESGSDSSTTVYPVFFAGHVASPAGSTGAAVVVARLVPPGAVGSGPVVIVGRGAVASVAGPLGSAAAGGAGPRPKGTAFP